MADTKRSTRFCRKFKVSSHGCWLWTATHTPNGYGQFWDGDKLMLAHRWAYERVNGPIPDGALVCHKCDSRGCVRPSHLFVGTAKDNSEDMVAKRRQYRGARHWKATLTDDAVRAIRSSPLRTEQIAEQFGITQPHASAIRLRYIWRAVE